MIARMSRPLRFSVFLVSLLSVVATIHPLPASAANTATSTLPKPTVTLVADVDVQDCSVTQASSVDQTVTATCTITNKLGTQGDIRYAMVLTKFGQDSLIDMKVYDQVLTLRENQPIKQSVVYVPPPYLTGKYNLTILLQTSGGLPLARTSLGTFTLKGQTKSYLEIRNESCSLRVKNDTGTSTYSIDQGVDIEPTETLEGSCIVTAHTQDDVTATPTFTTYTRNVFGSVATDTADVEKPIVFKKGKDKIISFIVPKAFRPQSYDTVLTLKSSDGKTPSTEAIIHYVLHGASATIQNVLLDKDYYAVGDTAQVSILWSPSADLFGGARKSGTDDKAQTVLLSIKDGNGNVCSSEKSFKLSTKPEDYIGLIKYDLPITQLCTNPQVSVRILDTSDTALATKEVPFASGPIPSNVLQANTIRQVAKYGLFIALIILAIVAFKRWRKNVASPSNYDEIV